MNEVLIVGGGLAGSLLALALRDLDQPVTLIDDGDPDRRASQWSYGVIPGWPLGPTPLAREAARAGSLWRRLQRRHGDLGWRPSRLRRWLPLPISQVDVVVLQRQLPALLERQGVERLEAEVQALEPDEQHWRLRFRDGGERRAEQVVLAAGSGCRRLWPSLPDGLRSSWAGVLALPRWPEQAGPQRLLLPSQFQRPGLERQAPQLTETRWVVDAGMVPWGDGALLGQISWINPGLDQGPRPEAKRSEDLLRQELRRASLPSGLADCPAAYLQVPVAFCSDGLPLVGPVPGAPGLWCFSGFSGAFAQVPLLAPLLARRLSGENAAEQALRRLQVWDLAR